MVERPPSGYVHVYGALADAVRDLTAELARVCSALDFL